MLRCNYDKKFLEKSNIPHFYRQILANFLELKTHGLQNESDVLLFNYKDIVIDGNTISHSKWFEKGIISVQDILDHTRKFLTFHEFRLNATFKLSTSNLSDPKTPGKIYTLMASKRTVNAYTATNRIHYYTLT